jgi:hypothetical protein
MKRAAAASLLLLALAAAAAEAQTPRKQAVAVRVAGSAPVLDGRLDDAAWAAAPPVTDFTQKEPAEGAPPSERTEVRFVYDDAALYVGARMYSRTPVRAPIGRRDVGIQADLIQFSIDTYLDRRTSYTFGVTAAGTRIDRYHPSDSESSDNSFNPVWEARVRTDSLGWTAEMRIPLSQLRFNPGASQRWGLNVNRWIPGREEDLYWVMIPRSENGWSSRFGELSGIEGVKPVRRIELSPYASTGARLTGTADPDDPFARPREATIRVGGDAKIGLGPNLTLDATVNPDFGQVEADPAEVNLSAFETFFPERRPFFTEGSQLLAGGGAEYFYSRRIGGAPRGVANADYVRQPDAATILGAAKLTGRLPSGLSVGALAAVTDREHARTFRADSSTFAEVEVEPRTGYAVARLQQEFGADASTVGVVLTATGRQLEDGTALDARLPRAALTGGVDWNLRYRGGAYEVSGAAGFSRVGGDSLAILRLQRSSARYFQRPDAGYVEVDPSLTLLSGYTASLNAARLRGEHWLWSARARAVSPGFDLNDAGVLSSADAISASGELRYRQTKPRGVLRRWDAYYTPNGGWNYAGVMTESTHFLDWDATWRNYWRTSSTLLYAPRVRSATLTRGGPLAGTRALVGGIARVANSASARLRWNGRIYYGENEDGRPTMRLSGGVAVRPGPRWELSVDPNYLRTVPVRQYVGVFDGGGEATYGRRYIFAAVDRSELFARIRLNYLFTPDLSLEFYGEPFASSGRYHDFGELPAAGSHRLALFGGDTARVAHRGGRHVLHGTRAGRADSITVSDFNVRSFRSNAVLRWEWRPGSTLHVVWQQDRAGSEDRTALVGPGSLLGTIGEPGDHVLAIKATYWIPLGGARRR